VAPRIRLYIGLAVLGVALIAAASLLLLRSAPATVSLPEGTPIVLEKLDYVMRGRSDRIYVYEDGSIVYTQDTNMRMPTAENPPTRIWSTGKLTQAQLGQILALLQSVDFATLESYYQYPPKDTSPPFVHGDMSMTVFVDYSQMSKTVTAFGYLTPDQGATYPDMPHPLDELYVKFRDAALSTKEVARAKIDTATWNP
jgi:hypothetical protein